MAVCEVMPGLSMKNTLSSLASFFWSSSRMHGRIQKKKNITVDQNISEVVNSGSWGSGFPESADELTVTIKRVCEEASQNKNQK